MVEIQGSYNRMDFGSIEMHYALMIIPCITGAISFCCSAVLIWSILTDKKNSRRVRERLLITLSVMDMFFSAACAMSTFTGPSTMNHLTPLILAGNAITCNLQGWMYQFGTCAPLFNAFICVYYLLHVRYKRTETELRKCMLPAMQVFGLLWALGSATAALFLGLYNFGGIFGCWIATEVPCEGDTLETCGWGTHNGPLLWVFGGAPVFLSILVSIIATSMLYCTVRSQEERSRSYDPSLQLSRIHRRSSTSSTFDSQNNNSFDCRCFGASWFYTKCNIQNWFGGQSGLSDRVRESALLYVSAFWLTYLPTLIIAIIEVTGNPIPNGLRVANVILLPLQGFFNVLIYKFFPDFKLRKGRQRVERRRLSINVEREQIPNLVQKASLEIISEIDDMGTIRASNPHSIARLEENNCKPQQSAPQVQNIINESKHKSMSSL